MRYLAPFRGLDLWQLSPALNASQTTLVLPRPSCRVLLTTSSAFPYGPAQEKMVFNNTYLIAQGGRIRY